MLLGLLQDDEYWADHGILVACDGPGDDAGEGEPDRREPRQGEAGQGEAGQGEAGLGPGIDPELLELFALQVQPGGTVAQAGLGWLWGRVNDMDAYHIVRLEAHDRPPADDRGDWDEVLETPYGSGTGTVQFATLTGGWDPDAAVLPIGRPGRYRVRVSCVRDPHRPGSDEYRSVPRRTPPGFPAPGTVTEDGDDAGFGQGDIWRLQFWPAPGDLEPPRWLVRTESPTGDADDGADDGEDDDDDGDDGDGDDPAEAAGGGLADGELSDTGLSDTGLSDTGLSDTALPDPDLPYGYFPDLATDLIFVALWTPAGTAGSVSDLAARVLATPDEVRAGLTTAIHDGHLRVAGNLADDGAPVTLTPVADAPPDYGEPQRIPIIAEGVGALAGLGFAAPDSGDNAGGTDDEPDRAGDNDDGRDRSGEDDGREDDGGEDDGGEDPGLALIGSGARRLSVSVFVSSPARSPLPYGPPPAAGIVTSNQELIVWRAGLPEVLAKVERYAERALATPYGIVVIGSKLAVLVRPDGEQRELAPSPDSHAVLSADGQHIAIASSKLGRRPKFGLYLANLADGSAEVLDLPDFFSVDALHDGVVRYGLAGDDGPACFSWAPGASPAIAPCLEGEIDRLSGTRLTVTEPREFLAGDYLVTRPDGTELTVKRRYDAQESQLSPGGRWLYDFWYEPTAMTVTDVSGPVAGPAVTWPLPDGCEISLLGGRRPQWEDETHVLLTAPYGTDVHAIRANAVSGAIERLRLDRHGRGERGHRDDGAEFEVEIYVEPFRQGRVPVDLPADDDDNNNR
jgi:hypothetical protein